jgi:hypothetical protein
LIAAVVFACLVALPVGVLMVFQSRCEDRSSI